MINFFLYVIQVQPRKELQTRTIIVHRSVEGNLLWTCGACGEHVVNIGEHVVNMSWICCENVLNMSWTCCEQCVNLSWTCCEHFVRRRECRWDEGRGGEGRPLHIIWPYIMFCVATYFQEFAQSRNIWDTKEKRQTDGQTKWGIEEQATLLKIDLNIQN